MADEQQRDARLCNLIEAAQVVLTEMYHAEECKGDCCLCLLEEAMRPPSADVEKRDTAGGV